MLPAVSKNSRAWMASIRPCIAQQWMGIKSYRGNETLQWSKQKLISIIIVWLIWPLPPSLTLGFNVSNMTVCTQFPWSPFKLSNFEQVCFCFCVFSIQAQILASTLGAQNKECTADRFESWWIPFVLFSDFHKRFEATNQKPQRNCMTIYMMGRHLTIFLNANESKAWSIFTKLKNQLFEVKYITTMLNAVTYNTEESVKLVAGTLYNKRHWTTISHHLLCYFWCSAALLSSTTKTTKSCLNTRGQMEGHN